MKRLFYGVPALTLTLGLGGCVDLGEKLVSSLGSSYIATPQGLTDATNATYAGLRGFYGRGETDYALTELGTDTWTAADRSEERRVGKEWRAGGTRSCSKRNGRASMSAMKR